MDMFLGQKFEFWARVGAALHKANISSAEELEARLGVSPPIYDLRQAMFDSGWEVIERRPTYGQERIVATTFDRRDAELVCQAMSKTWEGGTGA